MGQLFHIASAVAEVADANAQWRRDVSKAIYSVGQMVTAKTMVLLTMLLDALLSFGVDLAKAPACAEAERDREYNIRLLGTLQDDGTSSVKMTWGNNSADVP